MRPAHQAPTASDLVDRDFKRAGPNQLWVTDRNPTREGRVYCAIALDVFSGRVVRWSIDSAPTASLVTKAFGIAIHNRMPDAGTVIHSTHGTQFTSWVFTQRAKASGSTAFNGEHRRLLRQPL